MSYMDYFLLKRGGGGGVCVWGGGGGCDRGHGQLLLELSMGASQTLQLHYGLIQDVHMRL